MMNTRLNNLKKLKEKGIYIKHIKLVSGMTLAEEASQVDAEIQFKTVSSVSLFQKILIIIAGFLTGYLILATALAVLFIINPLPTSDFFGYYYRFNVNEETGNVLAAATGPNDIAYSTSVLADIIKPAATTSLVAVKAINNQRYAEIITPLSGTSGTDGEDGENGINGLDGSDGPVGAKGAAGDTGPQGIQGITGATGTMGTLTLGDGLLGNITNGDLTLNLGSIANSSLSNSNLTISAGNGLSGGGLVSLGETISLSLPNVGTLGTFGSATQVPVLIIDAQGRITGVTNTTITFTETDTLSSVTGRGASTSTNLILNGGITTATINSGSGNIDFTIGSTESSGKVEIGNSGTTTPDLLVLDNGTTDPTGVNGGAYYNTSTNKSRCYQNSVWTNCINGDIQLVGKITDQSVTSSTTLANDSALTFAVGSNETWIFNYFLFVTNNSSAQPDFKAAILGESGWTCSVQMSGSEAAGSAFEQTVSTDCDNIPTALINGSINADNNNGINVRIQGIITTTSAGSVILQFAQDTSSVSPITIKAGSYVQAFRISGL